MVELLDDLFARAAAADEPDELNFIKKHAKKLQAQGVTSGATARLFSNPAGEIQLFLYYDIHILLLYHHNYIVMVLDGVVCVLWVAQVPSFYQSHRCR